MWEPYTVGKCLCTCVTYETYFSSFFSLLVHCNGCSLLCFDSLKLNFDLWHPFSLRGNGAYLDEQWDMQGFTGACAVLFSVCRGRRVLNAVWNDRHFGLLYSWSFTLFLLKKNIGKRHTRYLTAYWPVKIHPCRCSHQHLRHVREGEYQNDSCDAGSTQGMLPFQPSGLMSLLSWSEWAFPSPFLKRGGKSTTEQSCC